MKNFVVHIDVNENLFSKDPQKTELGRRILSDSVLLLDEMGLDCFTFKKLAQKTNSTETSIYRYFDNKHQLFVYLLNWYWEWMMARIEFNTMNIADPRKRLQIVLNVLIDAVNRSMDVEYIDEEALMRIVVREGAKGYHHKMVEADNKEGFFLAYKQLSEKIVSILLEINPSLPYPRSVATILIEAAHNNPYNAKNLPRLTDLDGSRKNLPDQVKELLEFLAFGLLQNQESIPVQAAVSNHRN